MSKMKEQKVMFEVVREQWHSPWAEIAAGGGSSHASVRVRTPILANIGCARAIVGADARGTIRDGASFAIFILPVQAVTALSRISHVTLPWGLFF